MLAAELILIGNVSRGYGQFFCEMVITISSFRIFIYFEDFLFFMYRIQTAHLNIEYDLQNKRNELPIVDV